MTQISLKLFNKMPFVGSDIEEFFGGGVCAEIVAHVQVALSQVRCMYVRTSDQLAKAFPIALGACPAASLTSSFPIMIQWQACDVRANCSRRTAGNSRTDRLVAAITVLASLRRSLPGAGRRFAAMVHNGGFRFHGDVVDRGSSHDPLAGIFRGVARTGQLPAAGLPRTGVCGAVLDEDSWPVGIQGLFPVSKLLAVPLLLYHYERSERGHWVLFAFLAACVLLMGLSWVTYFADWKPSPGGIAGVPVRNYIDQSHEFALCLFVMAPLILSFAANGHRAWTFAFAAVMLGFYLDMRFVATSRTAFVYFPILLILFAVKYLNRRHAIYFLLFAAAVEFGVLLSSPYLRDRVVRTVQDYKVDRDTNARIPSRIPIPLPRPRTACDWRIGAFPSGRFPRRRFLATAPDQPSSSSAAKPKARAANGPTSSATRITRRFTSQSSGACSVASSSMRCGTSICSCFADPFLHHGSAW